MCESFALWLIIVFVVFETSEVRPETGLSRQKRLVWGKSLTEPDSFDAVRYFAYITKGNRYSYVSGLADSYRGEFPNPDPNDLRCGGTLISTCVVQTSCHCFAKFRKINESYHSGYAANGWEVWSSVFVGLTSVNDMIAEDGLWTVKFIVHEKCGMMMHRFADTLTHDFALVLLNRRIEFLNPENPDSAPAYSMQTSSVIYNTVLRNQQACLYLGFGGYYYRKPGALGDYSPVLRHGWRAARSYWYCFWRTFLRHRKHYVSEFGMHYRDSASWICTQSFGNHKATPLPGDDGGPVTCNNKYAGLASFRDLVTWKSATTTDYFSSVIFSPYENAIEYRPKMLAKLADYQKISEDPACKPFHIEGKNDWGPYFKPEEPTAGIWLIRRFGDTGSLDSIPDTSRPSRTIPKHIAWTVTVCIFWS